MQEYGLTNKENGAPDSNMNDQDTNALVAASRMIDPEKIDLWVVNSINGVQDSPLGLLAGTNREDILEGTGKIVDFLSEYKELLMRESCAIKEVKTKLEVLNTEYNVRSKRNPINNIQTRLKSTSSIIQKIHRIGAPVSVESIEENLNDIAGIRVVCEYIDDIYSIADSLVSQSDITLIRCKDYIKDPKPNGYRSLHLIVSVPVFFSQQTREMKVEVQIRTIAMDFWASLEHQMKYKKDIEGQERIVEELRDCAEKISAIDEKMLSLRNEIAGMGSEKSEEGDILEKILNLDKPING